MDGITRRRLLETGAAASAGVALGPLSAAAKPKKRFKRKADVAIVGAGLAGLTAALELEAAGHSVIVLEARDRVGGRVVNAKIGDGAITERGGTFIGPTQDRLAAMAQRLGVGTFPVYNEGETLYITADKRLSYSDTGVTGTAPPDPLILPDLALVIGDLNQRSTAVPVDAPWTAANAAALDAQTLASYIATNSLTQAFRDLVPIATRAILGAEPSQVSLLYLLFYIAASGNESNVGTFERNFNTRGGGQENRFVGGSGRIPNLMAKQLGRVIRLDTPVKRITQTKHGVVVRSRHVDVVAKRVIVAMPPALTGLIRYEPGLPADRRAFVAGAPQGTLTKVAAVYDKPFWRDAGLTGQVLTTKGPVSVTFDDSPEDGSKGVVFGFVGGQEGEAFATRSERDRRAAVLANFVDFFGPQAANPVRYLETNWRKDRWSRGCPVMIPTPGTLSAHGPALRAPIGHIHWAGSETSTYWAGYMDGAVRSGERAATEVAAEL